MTFPSYPFLFALFGYFGAGFLLYRGMAKVDRVVGCGLSRVSLASREGGSCSTSRIAGGDTLLTEAGNENSVGTTGSCSTGGDGSGFITGFGFLGTFFAGFRGLSTRSTCFEGFLGFTCLGGTFFMMSGFFSTGGGGVVAGEGK
jgi:hypothetical protein